MTSEQDKVVVKQTIDKVIDKIARVHLKTDSGDFEGRIYLGKLMCVDKTKAVFLQDALEIIDREAPDYFDHELFTPHLIKVPEYEKQPKVLKFVGNVIIPGRHIFKIELDNRMEKIYQEKKQKFDQKNKEYEQQSSTQPTEGTDKVEESKEKKE